MFERPSKSGLPVSAKPSISTLSRKFTIGQRSWGVSQMHNSTYAQLASHVHIARMVIPAPE